jgi:hypothetical protein
MARLGDMGICKVFPKVLVNAADLAEAYTTCGSMHNGPPSCIPLYAGGPDGLFTPAILFHLSALTQQGLRSYVHACLPQKHVCR